MNKEQILEEINKTERHLENMKKMLEECNYTRWKPKDGETFWLVDSYAQDTCTLYLDSTDEYNDRLFNSYNCFKTREEAKAESERILVRRQLEDIARRLNAGRKIDWASTTQRKYLIYFNHCCDRIELDNSRVHQIQGVIYCLDEKFLDRALKEIGEERLEKYLKGCWIYE